jgi:hypothetical protein
MRSSKFFMVSRYVSLNEFATHSNVESWNQKT